MFSVPFSSTNEGMAQLSDPSGARGPLRFRSSPQSPQESNDASDLSNIYVEREALVDNGISVEHSLTLFSPGLGRATLSNISHEEAATLIVLNFLFRANRGPVTSAAEFKEAVQSAISVSSSEPQESFRHRHPWSVFGGFFNRAGKPFLGYFQICLEQSGF